MRRRARWGLGAAAVLFVAGVWFVATYVAPTATGYTAKILCSAVFVAGRETSEVLAEDLAPQSYVGTEVDEEEKVVRATVFGLAGRTAVWRPGLGCTLAIDVDAATLREQGFEPATADAPTPDAPWPAGEATDDRLEPDGLDRQALDAAVAAGFDEPNPESKRLTRAVVVVHGGRIVAERYADGSSAATPHLGWSMTKSVTNALVGLLVHRGELDVSAPAPIAAWAGEGDPRSAITLDALMRMSSGLEFEERYGPLADATTMLFETYDAAAFAIDKPLAEPPDTQFAYSSGTTNILCWIVRERFASLAEYHRFPQEALFGPLGMRSAVFEPDPSGTFVGSSFMYATARDWARFGLLYLRDGVWVDGTRVLPEGWAAYSGAATATAPMGEYAAQFWANAGPPGDPAKRRLPSVPVDAYQASGFQGQAVLIVPSRDAVIVRLGMTHERAAWDLDAFAGPILAALPGA